MNKEVDTDKYFSYDSEFLKSGWIGSYKMWRVAREIILEAVDRDGTFLDIGCANGILVRDLRKWAQEKKGINLVPYGIDVVKELVEESKKNNPGFEKNFVLCNWKEFSCNEKFAFIRGCESRRTIDPFIKKYLPMLLADGRLILTFYDDLKDSFNLIDETIRRKGKELDYYFAGSAEVPGVTHVVWLAKRGHPLYFS